MIQAVFTASPSHILSWSISISQLTSWFQLKTLGAKAGITLSVLYLFFETEGPV